jgi:uncharacterized protein
VFPYIHKMDLEQFASDAISKKPGFQKFISKIKRKRTAHLDDLFHSLHEEVFEEVDCLTCANCCKTTSPIFIGADIDRISRFLKIKPSAFTEEYLKIDNEGDYVLKSSPCAFLGADNYCSIYEARPRACREYPHTNRKKMHQILDLTMRNTQVCPAVLQIVERLEKVI